MKSECALPPSCVCYDSQQEGKDSVHAQGPRSLYWGSNEPSWETLPLPSKHGTTDVSWTSKCSHDAFFFLQTRILGLESQCLSEH